MGYEMFQKISNCLSWRRFPSIISNEGDVAKTGGKTKIVKCVQYNRTNH